MTETQFTTEELKHEKWKAIPGYEGLYEVSNLGRVKSLRAQWNTRRSLILRYNWNEGGYLSVLLHKNSKRTRFRVNRIVALVFLDTPDNYEIYEADHKDGNIKNNRASNLQWLTKPEHTKITVERGQYLQAENHPNASLTNEEVAQIKWEMGEPHLIKDMLSKFNISLGVFESIKYGTSYTRIPWLRPPVKAIRPDNRKAISQAVRKLWENPEYRAHMVAAHKKTT